MRVVKVGSFKDFRAEVSEHGAVVRVETTIQDRGGQGPLAFRDLQLHIQGLNAAGELLWLCMETTLHLGPQGTLFSENGKKVDVAWKTLRPLVEEYLTSQGYDVRGGMYAIPADVKPLGGSIDFLRWDGDAGTFYIQHEQEEQ